MVTIDAEKLDAAFQKATGEPDVLLLLESESAAVKSPVVKTEPEKPVIASTQTTKAASPKVVVRSSEKSDASPMGNAGLSHVVHQGVITFTARRSEYMLAPWQVLPFSEGYEFLAAPYGVRFHRGVYSLDGAGEPVGLRSDYADRSWVEAVSADSICGFSGLVSRRFYVTCERLRFLRDSLSSFPGQQPWVRPALPMDVTTDLRPVLPQFWVELEKPPGGFRSANIPFSVKQDVTTGEVLHDLVLLEDWHLLAPEQGVNAASLIQCEQEFGYRFLMNRIYMSGTGISPVRDWSPKDARDGKAILLRLTDLVNDVLGKLTTVITPCLNQDRCSKDGSSKTPNKGQMQGVCDIISMHSAEALRNMLGNCAVAGAGVFAG